MIWTYLLFTLLNFCTNILSIDHKALPWIKGHHGMELNIVANYLPSNPIILEAGAHHGEDTVIFIKKWPQASVYAFEPCPEYFEILKRHTAPFPNIHIFPFGLTAKTGTYNFYISQKWNGASSMLADNHLSDGLDYNDQKIEVLCKNLDEWTVEYTIKKIDYMWLDMEGAELSMLNSAPSILKTVKAISCELNFKEYRIGMTQFDDIHSFLLKNEFSLIAIWGSSQGQATGVYIRN